MLVAGDAAIALTTLPTVARLRPDARVAVARRPRRRSTRPRARRRGYLGGMALAGACGRWGTGFDGRSRCRHASCCAACASSMTASASCSSSARARSSARRWRRSSSSRTRSMGRRRTCTSTLTCSTPRRCRWAMRARRPARGEAVRPARRRVGLVRGRRRAGDRLRGDQATRRERARWPRPWPALAGSRCCPDDRALPALDGSAACSCQSEQWHFHSHSVRRWPTRTAVNPPIPAAAAGRGPAGAPRAHPPGRRPRADRPPARGGQAHRPRASGAADRRGHVRRAGDARPAALLPAGDGRARRSRRRRHHRLRQGRRAAGRGMRL